MKVTVTAIPHEQKVPCIRSLRDAVKRLSLKDGVEILRDGKTFEFLPDEWKLVKPILAAHGCKYTTEGEKCAMDPLEWLGRVGGGIQVTQGPRWPGGDLPRKMFNVVIYPVDGIVTFTGPRKRSPRLAIERAMVKWAAFQAKQKGAKA